MYNIIQLNDKSLSELQTIAQELGIKKTDSLKKEELVYKILDEQAIAGATKKSAKGKSKSALVSLSKRKVQTKFSQQTKTVTLQSQRQRKRPQPPNSPKLPSRPKNR